MILNKLFRQITFLGLGLSATAAAVFLFLKNWKASLAVGVGASWIFLSFFFLFRIFQLIASGKKTENSKIPFYVLLKFPVIYLAGFFILKSKFFPVSGILAGISAFFASSVLCWVVFNLRRNILGKGAV